MLDKTVPYTTVEGFQYLIRFTEFDKNHLPESFSIPLVDVTIEIMAQQTKINNGKTLFDFCHIIQDYLDLNNIVLYFYCSHDPITKNKSRLHLSDAEFRSHLFCKMFEKQNFDKTFICENVIIKDITNGDHHIHLISKVKNEDKIEIMVKDGLPYFENK